MSTIIKYYENRKADYTDRCVMKFCREVQRLIAFELTVKSIAAGGALLRRMQFSHLPPFPCSGTYPSSLGTITTLIISKSATFDGRLRVRFDVWENGQCNSGPP